MNQGLLRSHSVPLCSLLLATLFTPNPLGAEKPKKFPPNEVDRSVIIALSHQGVPKPRILSHVDLTEPFGTATQWTLIVVQDRSKPPTELEDHGPIFVCLVKASSPNCALHLYQKASDLPYHLFADRLVYASQNKSTPLLFLKVCGEMGGNGNYGIATALYRYDKGTDQFVRVFLNLTGRNNNEATRFVESGPLRGDVIVNLPTQTAPYTYRIEVYRAGDSGRYERILRYRGHTGYSDGNPLAVIDSEMPEILRRLGLWRPGDPLPIPAHLPQGCRDLFMRHGEEWCK